MTSVFETYRLGNTELSLLTSLIDCSGVILSQQTFVRLGEQEACCESAWLSTRDDGKIRCSTKWFVNSVGNRYAALVVDELSPTSTDNTEIEICDAWIRDVQILSVAFDSDEVEVDVGVELTSHRGETSFITVADPGNHNDRCLAVHKSDSHLLGGRAVRRRAVH
jgi:hypothetical protein